MRHTAALCGRLALVTVTLALAGCGGTVGMAAIGGSAYVLGNTKKLPIDYLASSLAGRECSALEFEKTGNYCSDPPPPTPVDATPTYCYRSLGDVDCHTVPDPYHNHNRQVTDPPTRASASATQPIPAPASAAPVAPRSVTPPPAPGVSVAPVPAPVPALPKVAPGTPRPLVPVSPTPTPPLPPGTPGNRPRAADASTLGGNVYSD